MTDARVAEAAATLLCTETRFTEMIETCCDSTDTAFDRTETDWLTTDTELDKVSKAAVGIATANHDPMLVLKFRTVPRLVSNQKSPGAGLIGAVFWM